MRFIITGGTGFIGKWIVSEIINHGDSALLLTINDKDRPPEFSKYKNIEYIECPLDSLGTIDINIFPNEEFDVFLHLAWAGTSGELRANESVQLKNVEYSCYAVKLAKKLGCKKFINAGSIMEYEAFYTLIDGGFYASSNMMYSIGKLTADLSCKTLANRIGIDYSNVLIGNIFGAGEKSQRFVNVVIRKMLENAEINLTSCEQEYDFIYASDAARAIYLVCLNGKSNQSYYIGNKESRPLKEFVLKMKSVLGSQSKVNFGAVPFNNFPLSYKEFNMQKIYEELRFEPKVTFEEGVSLVERWINSEEKKEP